MKRTLTRLLAMLCAFGLLFSCALAEPTASRTAVTIDGMRTAFFDEAGNYLPVMEHEGRLYAPALSLGSNLGVAVTADADTLAVTVGGIRAAFFTPEGDYIAPLNVAGVVYVPLVAFAENLGYTVTTGNGTFAIVREQAAPTPAPTAVPTATPRPTIAPTQVPQYGHVPVSELNWRDFFTLEKTHTQTSDSPNTASFTWSKVVSCRPTTSYDVVNVRIGVEGVGTIVVSGSGTGSASRSKTIYRSDYKDKYAYQQAIAFEQLYMAYDGIAFTVESGSGTMRMSWHEAEAILAGYYEHAESCLAKDRADLAVKWFDLLSRVDYRDSADRKAEAQKQLKAAEEAARKAELDRTEAQYQAALADLEAGNYQRAISAFAALADKQYKDSAARHAAAVTAEKQHRYDQADAAEKHGDPDAALTLFNALKNEGFSDAARRVAIIWYRKGEAAMTAGKYSEAVTAFTSAGNFQDAAERIKAAHYAKGEDMLAAGNLTGAISSFTSAGNYQDAAERIKAARYAKAAALLDAGNTAAAADDLRKIPGYQDADELLAQLPMIEANRLMASGRAREAFRKLLDMETTDQIQTARRKALYMIGMEQLQSDRPSGAVTFFSASGYADWQEKLKASWYAAGQYEKAGDYLDAEERYKEGVYQQALAKYNQENLSKSYAYREFSRIHGYRDVDQLLSSAEMTAVLKKMLVEGWVDEGAILTFGSYAPIGGDGTKQPIEWIIIDVSLNSKKPSVTLLSRHVLDVQPFGSGKQKWAQSDLSKWLNGAFLRTAFTQAEQNALMAIDGKKVSIPANSYKYYNKEISNPAITAGMTVAGEQMRFWMQDGTCYPYNTAASGSVGVRPMITINPNTAGIDWGRYTYTDCPNNDLTLSNEAKVRLLMDQANYAEAFALLKKMNKPNENDYAKCVIHLAFEACIQGAPSAARSYLNYKNVRVLMANTAYYQFLADVLGIQ